MDCRHGCIARRAGDTLRECWPFSGEHCGQTMQCGRSVAATAPPEGVSDHADRQASRRTRLRDRVDIGCRCRWTERLSLDGGCSRASSWSVGVVAVCRRCQLSLDLGQGRRNPGMVVVKPLRVQALPVQEELDDRVGVRRRVGPDALPHRRFDRRASIGDEPPSTRRSARPSGTPTMCGSCAAWSAAALWA